MKDTIQKWQKEKTSANDLHHDQNHSLNSSFDIKKPN